ncbi:hypothetical protein D3C85_1406720 [compost metagenome]
MIDLLLFSKCILLATGLVGKSQLTIHMTRKNAVRRIVHDGQHHFQLISVFHKIAHILRKAIDDPLVIFH